MAAPRRLKPSVSFEFVVEKIIGCSGNGRYQVQLAPMWIREFHLVDCHQLIEQFLQQEIAEKDYLGDQEEKLDLVQEQEQHQDRKYSPASWSDTAWWTHGWSSQSLDQRLNPGSVQVHSDCSRSR